MIFRPHTNKFTKFLLLLTLRLPSYSLSHSSYFCILILADRVFSALSPPNLKAHFLTHFDYPCFNLCICIQADHSIDRIRMALAPFFPKFVVYRFILRPSPLLLVMLPFFNVPIISNNVWRSHSIQSNCLRIRYENEFDRLISANFLSTLTCSD